MPKKKRNKKRKHTKKEDDNINNNNNIIIENNNNNDNAEIEGEKNDFLIDYKKFINENNNLFEYLLNSKFPLLIESYKFESEINLESNSFIKIIKQAKLEIEFKLYLTK